MLHVANHKAGASGWALNKGSATLSIFKLPTFRSPVELRLFHRVRSILSPAVVTGPALVTAADRLSSLRSERLREITLPEASSPLPVSHQSILTQPSGARIYANDTT